MDISIPATRTIEEALNVVVTVPKSILPDGISSIEHWLEVDRGTAVAAVDRWIADNDELIQRAVRTAEYSGGHIAVNSVESDEWECFD